jgi:hypothetical protein
MPEAQTGGESPPLNHTDYCTIIGQMYIDSYMAMKSLRNQSTKLINSLQRQIEEGRRPEVAGDGRMGT